MFTVTGKPTPAPEPEPDNEVLDGSAFLANIDVDIFDKQSANKHQRMSLNKL